MLVARTEAELSEARALLGQSRPVALVPTMGALHNGHRALVDAARAEGHDVIASIFVNPLQFDAGHDLARYPVDQDRDLATLRDAGCAVAWLPTVSAMYPRGNATTINVEGPALEFEGRSRPGHFRGVATVVAILIGQTQPASAWFGEKDWQQWQVVRRMIADLRLRVQARSIPTVRESDGLALSSRNRFLTASARRIAPRLYEVMAASASEIGAGGHVETIIARACASLVQEGFVIDYFVLVDGEKLVAIERHSPGARLLAAVSLGDVRLLDNIAVS
jgi:pantoate--beta-alanine ligase